MKRITTFRETKSKTAPTEQSAKGGNEEFPTVGTFNARWVRQGTQYLSLRAIEVGSTFVDQYFFNNRMKTGLPYQLQGMSLFNFP